VVTTAAAAALVGAAACMVVDPGTAPAMQAKKGKETARLISGPMESVAPTDALITAIKQLNEKARKDVEDEEYEQAAMRFAVAAEVGKLLTMRDNAELKSWGDRAGKAFLRGAKENLDKEDAAAVFKDAAKLLAESDKASKKWSGAKAVNGAYTPANQNLKHLMNFTAEVNTGLRRAVGLPGMRSKEYVESAWVLAEIGGICVLYSGIKDWREWSAKHRDISAGIAKSLAKGDPNEAKKGHAALEANCKSCHDKYQNDVPKK
jgi:hypothetical protein